MQTILGQTDAAAPRLRFCHKYQSIIMTYALEFIFLINWRL